MLISGLAKFCKSFVFLVGFRIPSPEHFFLGEFEKPNKSQNQTFSPSLNSQPSHTIKHRKSQFSISLSCLELFFKQALAKRKNERRSPKSKPRLARHIYRVEARPTHGAAEFKLFACTPWSHPRPGNDHK